MPSVDEAVSSGAAPVVAILRGIRPDEAVAIGMALVEVGVKIIEVPLNSPEPFESITRLVDALGERAVIGAGTVLRPGEVDRLARIGARLVVSPNCNAEVIAASVAAGMTSLPGVMTPSEAFAALEAGTTRLKLFPAASLPLGHGKALREVLPAGTGIWAVGGIDAGNLRGWLDAGCEGVGLGGSLYRAGMGADEVAANARSVMTALHA